MSDFYRSVFVGITWIVGAYMLGTSAVLAKGTCLNDNRQVDVPGKSVRFQSLLCRLDDAQRTSIRVERHRLSSLASAALVGSRSDVRPEALLNRSTIVRNPIFETYKRLVDAYAETSSYDRGSLTGIFVDPDNNRRDSLVGSKFVKPSKADTFITVELPGGALYLGSGGPIDTQVADTLSLPGDFKQYYFKHEQEGQPASGAVAVWRYIDDAFLAGISGTDVLRDKNAVAMLRSFGDGTLPQGLAIAVGTLSNELAEECGPPAWSGLAIHLPKVHLDVITITNITRTAISLDRLAGAERSETALRRSDSTSELTRDPIPSFSPIGLAPGETVTVPVAITLKSPKSFAATATERAVSDRVWQAINRRAKTAIYSFGPASEERIDKLASGFKAPEYPDLHQFNYGPAWSVNSMVVNGAEIDLMVTTPNFLNMAVANAGASCPYAAFFDERHQTWISLGKVIHTANGKKAATSQVITVPGLVRKIRLEEREPETAFIDQVSLEVVLENDRILHIPSSEHALHSVDDLYLEINYGQSRVIAFDVPTHVKPEEVLHTKLRIAGYYERHRLPPPAPQSVRFLPPQNAYSQRLPGG